jgi:hypothetical protein
MRRSTSNRRLTIVEKPRFVFQRGSAYIFRGVGGFCGYVADFLNNDKSGCLAFLFYVPVCVMGLLEGRHYINRLDPGQHRGDILLAFFVLFPLVLLLIHNTDNDRLKRRIIGMLLTPLWGPPFLVMVCLFLLASSLLGVMCIIGTAAGILLIGIALCYSLWRKRQGISIRCTKGDCQSARLRFRDLDIRYSCPGGCGERYGYLLPSHYGLLYHHCTCGGKLPAAQFLRMRKNTAGIEIERTLQKFCPIGHAWGIGVEARATAFVAVAGGISNGKTCYVTMLINELLNRGDVGFENTDEGTKQAGRYSFLSMGRRLPPTERGVPEAIVLRMKGNSKDVGRLYLYDAAGELYSQVERGAKEDFLFFEDLSGIILLVDPLGLPKFRQAFSGQDGGTLEGYGASETPFEDVVASVCRNVRNFVQYNRSGRTTVPLAVVISKGDLPEVREKIGFGTRAIVGKDEHTACREALRDWGAVNEVSALQREFE